MLTEKITVVVPAYNTAPWLERSLDSLMAQTYENLEVVVVNDGSTDDTAAVLDAYAAKEPRVRAIHKENGGVTSARLRGVSEATGSWIGFMDGDDEIAPDMYARLMRNAKSHDADISHCGYQVLFLDGRINYVHNSGQLRIQDHLTGVRDLLDGGMIESSLCTKLYRRELFDGLQDFIDPAIRINEDYLMNYYLFSRSEQSVFEDFCPYTYILRQGSASYKVLHEHSIFDPIRVREMILEHCVPELKEDAKKAQLRNLLFSYAQLVMDMSRKFDGFRSRVRNRLKEEKEYYYLLSTRNKVLAHMICLAPWLFCAAYRAYVTLIQREEQH
ncbi:MAG: glycosyltransferase family 2 protein [Oscillospiraceae bacterium]|nr:glycosyltransferase family 2 protein [Oscillospiraceae bacterium]